MKLVTRILLAGLAVFGPLVQASGEPRAIVLQVGVEQRIEVADLHAVGLPAVLTEPAMLRHLVLDDALYLTARQPFDPARILIERSDNGPILLDVSAVAGDSSQSPSTSPLPAIELGRDATLGASRRTAPSRRLGGDVLSLLRFAAHQDYAPSRVRSRDPAIRPDRTAGSVTYAAKGVAATVRHVYRLRNLRVIALELTASAHHSLDSRWVDSGATTRVLATAWLREALIEAGDSTLLYVVTEDERR